MINNEKANGGRESGVRSFLILSQVLTPNPIESRKIEPVFHCFHASHPVHSLSMKCRYIRLIPVAFALIFFLQGYFGSLSKSLTWDEPVFIASGYSYLKRGDFRMNPEAPPLLQYFHALPLLNLPLKFVSDTHPIWQKAAHIELGQHFIQANAQYMHAIAQRARLPMLLIGAGLVYAIFAWGCRLYGFWPALFASALAACSPNLLAHAKLATTDLGCAAFVFFAVFAFYIAVQKKRWPAYFLCGLMTGLALLTKYTALLLGPVYLCLGLWVLWCRILSFTDLCKAAFIIGITCILVIGAGYGFSSPFAYVEGFQKIYATAQSGYQFYLLGEVSDRPWWYYYFVAFVLKTPLSTLILIGLGAVVLIRKSDCREAAFFLLIPVVFMFVASCFDQTNLGYRRILPALPFVLLFCAHAIAAMPRRRVLIAVLVVLSAVEAARIYPHHLSYFNLLAGGPTRGPYLLDDSNIDWGQDLPGLARWQKEHPEAQPLYLSYFGNVPPELYGVQARDFELNGHVVQFPQPGYYAISAHHLAWFRKISVRYGLDADWLAKYTPIDRIGYSIYIYRFPQAATR